MHINIKGNIFLFLFWFLPLVSGMLTFISWIITRLDVFILPGIIILYSVFFISIIGSLILFIQFLLKKGKHLLLKLFLLLSNIPVGLVVAVISFSLLTQYTVIIENKSDSVLVNCIIKGGGIQQEIEKINPREQAKKRFWIKYDGTLYLSFQKGNKNTRMLIDGYVTNGMGGQKTITIK